MVVHATVEAVIPPPPLVHPSNYRLFIMSHQETVLPSGQHYSGANRIPNIKQFIESLDREKAERDAQIDASLNKNRRAGEVTEHQETSRRGGKNRRTVRDPVTGKDVEIDDIDSSYVKSAQDPQVRSISPLGANIVDNLGKLTLNFASSCLSQTPILARKQL